MVAHRKKSKAVKSDQAPLTEAQRHILRLIGHHWATYGVAPSIRWLMEQLLTPNPNGVVCHIKALQKKGYITTSKMIARSIEVTGVREVIGKVVQSRIEEILRSAPSVN